MRARVIRAYFWVSGQKPQIPGLSLYSEFRKGRRFVSITVQRATTNDLAILYQIERECFTIEAFGKEHLAFLLEDPNAVGLVAQMNGKVAGFIIGLIRSALDGTKVGHIYTLDVAIEHRRKGVGLRLLNDLERIFVEEGVDTCYLEARLDNVAARELYHKQGYVEVERLEHYYHRGVHGVRLRKVLKTSK